MIKYISMKKCIYITVFNNEQYVNMCYLLLESIFIYGNLDTDTEILIYTSENFKNMIQNSSLMSDKICFEINNAYNDIYKACRARLDLFNLKSTKNYERILYLDTDILVKDDVNKVFDVVTDDNLYVLQEGTINDSSEFWGNYLFGDEVALYEDKTAFNSGILLFNNCDKMKQLFQNITYHMNDSNVECIFYDQPYFVYNAFKMHCYNNKALSKYAVMFDSYIFSDKVIHHFAGGPGIHGHKIDSMARFLYILKDHMISFNIEKTIHYINAYLLPIIKTVNEPLEGNIFMLHHTMEYTDVFLNKAKNLSNLVLNNNVKHILEIGFNAGFSTLLMLISNPKMHITCVDLGEHKYTRPCFEQLKRTFGDRIDIVFGDSRTTLPNLKNKYDVIHIDGGHETEVAESDIIACYKLSQKGTIIIMDDYDFANLHELWNKYVNIYNLQPVNIHTYTTLHHDIKYRN